MPAPVTPNLSKDTQDMLATHLAGAAFNADEQDALLRSIDRIVLENGETVEEIRFMAESAVDVAGTAAQTASDAQFVALAAQSTANGVASTANDALSEAQAATTAVAGATAAATAASSAAADASTSAASALVAANTANTAASTAQATANAAVPSAVLASDTGSSLVGFKRPDTGAVRISLEEINNASMSVLQAGAKADGVTDSTAAFQRAINWAVAAAQASGKSYAVPAIVIPGGWYKLSDTLQMKPWVHLVTDGPVFLDFTSIATSKPGIVCDNNTTLPLDDARFSGNHSPFLDGSRGTITIIGPGKATSTAAGVKLGNFSSGLRPFRDARMSNVVITGWNAAQEWGNFDTYLCRTENCRFEQNNYGVMAANGASTNSGERMEWSGCTIAGSIACLLHNQPGFDANFYGCSFDFNDDVIRLGATSNFCSVRLEHCYFEAFSGYIVDGNLLTGSDNTNQMSVMMTNPIILARGRDSSKGVNSPSRNMFRGAFSLSINGIKARYESRPYLEDSFLIASNTTVVNADGYHVAPYQLPMRPAQIINDDFDFQRNADGTSADSLTSWERTAGGMTGTITNRDIFTVSGKKVLRVVAATGTNTSAITFRSKGKIECKAGDTFFSNICLNAGGATGNVLVISRVEFYDSADQLLSSLPSFADYPFRSALNDTTLPNFAEGNNRWMDTHGYRAVAPKNTAYAKQNFYIGSFDGTIYVSRARLWRG